jgi:hypothetical protein
MVAFPSVEWFEALGERVAEDRDLFRRLGYFDANMGVKIDANGAGTKGYVVQFEGYGVKGVHATPAPEQEADFTIEGAIDAWTEMVDNIRINGEPDLLHTLNRMTMAGTPLKVVAHDQLQTDVFYRFNQTIQAFFNEAAEVPTEYAVVEPETVGAARTG